MNNFNGNSLTLFDYPHKRRSTPLSSGEQSPTSGSAHTSTTTTTTEIIMDSSRTESDIPHKLTPNHLQSHHISCLTRITKSSRRIFIRYFRHKQLKYYFFRYFSYKTLILLFFLLYLIFLCFSHHYYPYKRFELPLPLLLIPTTSLCEDPINGKPQNLFIHQSHFKIVNGYGGIFVKIEYIETCKLIETHQLSTFRIFAQSREYWTATDPTIILTYQNSIEHFLPLPHDYVDYIIHVRLMLWNATIDLLSKDYPNHHYITETYGKWIEADIRGSPFNFKLERDVFPIPSLSYDQISLTTSSSTIFTSAPLCHNHSKEVTLLGGWEIGPRIYHPNNLLWDKHFLLYNYEGYFSPYSCRIDYSVDIIEIVKEMKWLHLIGDSNTRYLFDSFCDTVGGDMTDEPVSLQYWDPPLLCSFDDNRSVITFTNWFYGKTPPLHFVKTTWEAICLKYTEDKEIIQSRGQQYGFPNCQQVSDEIKRMNAPTLTIFGWGSHGTNLGVNDKTYNYIHDELLSSSYFLDNVVLFFVTEAADVGLIPSHFGKQYIYLNNERIFRINDLFIKSIANRFPTFPGYEKSGSFFPVLDFFSLTNSANERLHNDAIHFELPLKQIEAKIIASWAAHAPQLQEKIHLKKKNAFT